MERKFESWLYCVLFVILHFQKEYNCYQLTGIVGCRDIYVWTEKGIASCKYLTRPSRYLLHTNPKFYCTEYPLTRCCETCTVLERHNYRNLYDVQQQTTAIPATTIDIWKDSMTEITQKRIPLKTFFTVPVVQEQTTTSSLTRRTTNKMLGRVSVTKHTQSALSLPVSTAKPRRLPNITQTLLSRQNTDRTVQQLFTLPPEIRRFDQTNHHAMATVKYSMGTADENIPTINSSPALEAYKTVLPTLKTTAPQQETIKPNPPTTTTAPRQETIKPNPPTTTTTAPRQETIKPNPPTTTTTAPQQETIKPNPPTTTTTAPRQETIKPNPPTTTTTAPRQETIKPNPTSTTTKSATTTPTTTTTSSPATSSSTAATTETNITTRITARITQQKEIFKRKCTDIGILLMTGSVPCYYLEKDNKYGLNKNQSYFCNRYPLTSCCETCKRINIENGK